MLLGAESSGSQQITPGALSWGWGSPELVPATKVLTTNGEESEIQQILWLWDRAGAKDGKLQQFVHKLQEKGSDFFSFASPWPPCITFCCSDN